MVSVPETFEQAASVRKSTAADVPAMAGVLARAFYDDPVFSWVLKADPKRMRMLERGFELFLRRIWMEQEQTYTTADIVGVAAWELPGKWKVGLGLQLRLAPAMIRIFGRRLPRVLRALMAIEASHPTALHYYLPFIGVEPAWQGRGLGSALLAPVLERCDRERLPAFLEASTPRNRAMYERHGFDVMEEFKLGQGAPPQWRMWRQPRADADAAPRQREAERERTPA
jgi:GNAT superfamily N-acetyltransferase